MAIGSTWISVVLVANIVKDKIEYIKENEFYLDYKTGACIKGVIPLLEILDKGE